MAMQGNNVNIQMQDIQDIQASIPFHYQPGFQQQHQQQQQQQQQNQIGDLTQEKSSKQMMWSSFQSKQERNKAFQEQKQTLEQSLKQSLKTEYQPITLTFQVKNEQDQENIDIIITPDDQKNGIHVITNFSQYFELYEVIGEGSVGITYRSKKIKNGAAYAVKLVKVIDKKTIYNIKHDFFKIKNLKHPNIVQTYEMYIEDDIKDAKKIYIIMEYITCQKLFDVIDEYALTEELTKKIFNKILTGIKYMHQQGVCHRDLKPDNILTDKTGNTVKILDFNIAKFSDDYKAVGPLVKYKIPMHTYIGTLEFSAPEIFTGEEYYESCDIWSAGVILYTMLSRSLPFFGEFIHELIDQIQVGIYEMPDDPWLFISSQAKDLVSRCLTVDVYKRITIEEALKHGFFFEKPAKSEGSDIDSSSGQSQILKKSLKKEEIIQNTIISKKLQSSQINKSGDSNNQLPIEAFLFNDKNVFITKKLENNLTKSLQYMKKPIDINSIANNEVSQIINPLKSKMMLQSADQVLTTKVSQSQTFGQQKKGMANQSSINRPIQNQCEKILENNFEATGDSEQTLNIIQNQKQ